MIKMKLKYKDKDIEVEVDGKELGYNGFRRFLEFIMLKKNIKFKMMKK